MQIIHGVILLVLVAIVQANIQCELETGICKDWRGTELGQHSSLKPLMPNREISPFVKELVSTLSLRAKIGQMTQLDVTVLLNSTALAQGIVSLNQSALYYGVYYYGVGSYLNSPFSGGKVGNLSVSTLHKKMTRLFLLVVSHRIYL